MTESCFISCFFCFMQTFNSCTVHLIAMHLRLEADREQRAHIYSFESAIRAAKLDYKLSTLSTLISFALDMMMMNDMIICQRNPWKGLLLAVTIVIVVCWRGCAWLRGPELTPAMVTRSLVRPPEDTDLRRPGSLLSWCHVTTAHCGI